MNRYFVLHEAVWLEFYGVIEIIVIKTSNFVS